MQNQLNQNKITNALSRKCLFIFFCAVFVGCTRNPITGKTEFAFSPTMTSQSSIRYFNRLQQSDGGPFTADPHLIDYVNMVTAKVALASSHPQAPYECAIINNSSIEIISTAGKIGISRGLLVELKNEAQLASLIAHEIAHRERHELSETKYSREQELEADETALAFLHQAGYDSQALIAVQKLLHKIAKSKSGTLFSFHPLSKDRIETIRKKNIVQQGGFVGEEQYLKAITHLRQVMSNYKNYEKGKQLLAAGFTNEAMAIADSITKAYPEEALFSALKAEVFVQKNELPSAIEQYTHALDKNPYYYLFFLNRGKAYMTLKQSGNAKKDFYASLLLLNKAETRLLLAELLFQTGQVKKGLEQVQIVAKQFSGYEDTIEGLLNTIALQSSLLQNLLVQKQLDPHGVLHVTVVNNSETNIHHIVLKVVEHRDKHRKVALLEEIVELKPHEQIVLLHQLNTKEGVLPEISVINAE